VICDGGSRGSRGCGRVRDVLWQNAGAASPVRTGGAHLSTVTAANGSGLNGGVPTHAEGGNGAARRRGEGRPNLPGINGREGRNGG
jgi:hypothetical protein